MLFRCTQLHYLAGFRIMLESSCLVFMLNSKSIEINIDQLSSKCDEYNIVFSLHKELCKFTYGIILANG